MVQGQNICFAQKKSELAKNAKIHAFDAKISGEIDKTISNGARDGILSFRSGKPIRTIKIGNILWAAHNNSLQKPVRAGLAEADDGFTCTNAALRCNIRRAKARRQQRGAGVRWLKNMVHNASPAFFQHSAGLGKKQVQYKKAFRHTGGLQYRKAYVGKYRECQNKSVEEFLVQLNAKIMGNSLPGHHR